MREATVADCIDFADANENHEEHVTTLFLNRVQMPETYLDSKHWTAADRRLGLVWYMIHTVSEHTILLPYTCSHCSEEHTWAFDVRDILAEYRSIEGKAERFIEWNGETIKVVPLSGSAIEELEFMHLAKNNKDGSIDKRQEAKTRLNRFLFSIDLTSDTETEMVKRWKNKEQKILAMKSHEFVALAQLVDEKLDEMEHGLNMIEVDGRLHLVTPPHECPNMKGQVTRLRVTFRNNDYIPGI
jgi:hypothetical protein